MNTKVPDTTAIILAGGKGRRMNLQNKGLIKLGETPLIDHVINIVKPQVDRIIISANQDLDQYESRGFLVVPDRIEGFLGPLAGISSALRYVETPFVVVAPCDSPFIPRNYVAKMAEHFHRSAVDVCVLHDGERTQPLFMFLKTETGLSILESLEQGNRKVFGWLNSVSHKEVDFSDAANAFMNINTPQELQKAEQTL